MSSRTLAAAAGHQHYQRTEAEVITTTIGFSNLGIVANRLYAVPIQIISRIHISRIGWGVSGVQVGNLRAGIYRDNGDTPVGGALLAEAGPVACGAVWQRQEVAIDVILDPGLYWGVIISDNAPQLLGNSVVCATGGTLQTGWVAQAFGALPNPYPAGFNVSQAPFIYLVGLLA